MQLIWQSSSFKLRHFYQLTKPRVVALVVFCAVIGMLLATPHMVPWRLLAAATLGIWLAARGAAAVPDHLCLDAAALLGAGVVPHRRFCQGGAPHASGDSREPLHPPAGSTLHPPPFRLLDPPL